MGRSNRRLTGFVVARDVEVPGDWKLKPISDLMDEARFTAPMLELFEFIARYYRSSLGDAIRAGLPAAFSLTESRRAELTAVGREHLSSSPILSALALGPKPVRSLECSVATLLVERDGLVHLKYELERRRLHQNKSM